MTACLRSASGKGRHDRVRRCRDFEKRPRRRDVPVHADPVASHTRLMRHRRFTAVRLRRRRPGNHVVAPVPEQRLILRSRHREADEAIVRVAIDARLVDVRVRVCLLRAGSRLITDDRRAARPAHPCEEGVVLVLVQPHGIRFAGHRPPATGHFGHRADVDAANDRSLTHIEVVRRGRIVGERRREVHQRRKGVRHIAGIRNSDAGREVDQPVRAARC